MSVLIKKNVTCVWYCLLTDWTLSSFCFVVVVVFCCCCFPVAGNILYEGWWTRICHQSILRVYTERKIEILHPVCQSTSLYFVVVISLQTLSATVVHISIRYTARESVF